MTLSDMAKGLTPAQRNVLVTSENGELTRERTARSVLIGGYQLVSYNFRPARLTLLGLQVRAHILGESE